MKKISVLISLCIALALIFSLTALPAQAADGTVKVLSGFGNDNGGNGNHNGEDNTVANFLMNYGTNDGNNGNYNGDGETVEGFLMNYGTHDGNNGNDERVESFLMNYGSHDGNNGNYNGNREKVVLDVGDLVNFGNVTIR